MVLLIALLQGLQPPPPKEESGPKVPEANNNKTISVVPTQIAAQPSNYSQALEAEKVRELERQLEEERRLRAEALKNRPSATGAKTTAGGKIEVLEPYTGSAAGRGQGNYAPDDRVAAEQARLMQRVREGGIFFESDTPKGGAAQAIAGVKQGLSQVGGAGLSGAGITDAGAQVEELMKSLTAAVPQMEEKDPVLKQNQQELKQDFINEGKDSEFYNASFTRHPSPYILTAGGIIPAVTRQGVNTDLPGEVTAHVTQNVYDSITGRFLLIPQGSTINGRYQSVISYGQERVLIGWRRLCRPDGCINLGNQLAVDAEGYSGLSDQVDNHYDKIFLGVLASSVLSAGAATSQGVVQNGNPTFGQYAVAGVGQDINQAGEKILEKNLNIQPTLTIRPGQRFGIQIDKDFIIPPVRNAG